MKICGRQPNKCTFFFNNQNRRDDPGVISQLGQQIAMPVNGNNRKCLTQSYLIMASQNGLRLLVYYYAQIDCQCKIVNSARRHTFPVHNSHIIACRGLSMLPV